MKIESRFVFYPRYAAAIVVKAWHYLSVYRNSMRMLKEVLKAPDRWSYTDLAIAPPRDDELDTLDLYHVTSGGEVAVARTRRDDAARARHAEAAD